MTCEWNILNHHEHISNRQPYGRTYNKFTDSARRQSWFELTFQYRIDGRLWHFLPRQYDDVQDVCDGSKHTNLERFPNKKSLIALAEDGRIWMTQDMKLRSCRCQRRTQKLKPFRVFISSVHEKVTKLKLLVFKRSKDKPWLTLLREAHKTSLFNEI